MEECQQNELPCTRKCSEAAAIVITTKYLLSPFASPFRTALSPSAMTTAPRKGERKMRASFALSLFAVIAVAFMFHPAGKSCKLNRTSIAMQSLFPCRESFYFGILTFAFCLCQCLRKPGVEWSRPLYFSLLHWARKKNSS